MKTYDHKIVIKRWLPWIILIVLLNAAAYILLRCFDFRFLPVILTAIGLIVSMTIYYFICKEKSNFWIAIMMIGITVVIKVTMNSGT